MSDTDTNTAAANSAATADASETGNTNAPDDQAKRAVTISRVKMIALISIYAAPLLAAWIWLGYVRSNEGAGVRVNGELITPAVPVTDFALQDAAGGQWGLNDLKEKWLSLIHI